MMWESKNYSGLIDEAKKQIPEVDKILEEALKKLNLTPFDIERNFSRCLVSVDNVATKIYHRYEEKAIITLTENWLETLRGEIRERLKALLKNMGWEEFKKEASKIFVEFGKLVQDLEKDLGNMRKARGGRTFEKAVRELLERIGIQVEAPPKEYQKQLKRIDLVVPSVEVALRTPDRAYFLTCKRTLRERWKQEVPQVRRGWRVYLITIDSELPASKADEINEKELIAFVRDDLKRRDELRDKEWIRSLNTLPEELKRR